MQLVSGKVRLKTVADHLARIITISLGYLGLERHRGVVFNKGSPKQQAKTKGIKEQHTNKIRYKTLRILLCQEYWLKNGDLCMALRWFI